MGDRTALELDQLSGDLQVLAKSIEQAAVDRTGNELALLELLRLIEFLHAYIRDEFFQDALPTNRQRLYALLRDIEVNGGWPYIQRMRIRSLLGELSPEDLTQPNKESER